MFLAGTQDAVHWYLQDRSIVKHTSHCTLKKYVLLPSVDTTHGGRRKASGS
jgi:hypothetical protein